MARYFIGDQEILADVPQNADLSVVLAALEKSCEGKDICIKEIFLDSTPIPMSDFDPKTITPTILAGISEIRIIPASLDDLARSAIDGFLSYLDTIEVPLQNMTTTFRKGATQDSYKQLTMLLEGFQEIFRLLELVHQCGDMDIWKLSVDGETVSTTIENFSELLEELGSSIEEQNSYIISDLLEFEILPQRKRFQQILNAVKDKLA